MRNTTGEKIIEKLRKLGFSEQEAKIYLALLSVGESSVGGIIDETKYHREIVYTGLANLENQGLVQSKIKKKKMHYWAIEPAKLVQKNQERAETAEKLLPDLKKIYKENPLSIQLFEGPDGYEEIQKDIQVALKNREKYFVIGGAGDNWYRVTKEFYKKYHKKLLKRGILMLTVTSKKEAEGIAKYENPEFNPVRVMPENFAAPSSTMIYGDRVIIHVFGESPMAIMIRSKAVSGSYKNYFNALWDMSEEYKYYNYGLRIKNYG